MRLNFGKYHGFDIEDVPLSYLKWCEREFKAGDLRKAITKELTRRQGGKTRTERVAASKAYAKKKAAAKAVDAARSASYAEAKAEEARRAQIWWDAQEKVVTVGEDGLVYTRVGGATFITEKEPVT